MKPKSPTLFGRKITQFCNLRISPHVSPAEFEKMRSYLSGLISYCASPQMHLGRADLVAVLRECGISTELNPEAKKNLRYALDAVDRWVVNENTKAGSKSTRTTIAKA